MQAPVRYRDKTSCNGQIILECLIEDDLRQRHGRRFTLHDQVRVRLPVITYQIETPPHTAHLNLFLDGNQLGRITFTLDQKMNEMLPYPLFRSQHDLPFPDHIKYPDLPVLLFHLVLERR